MKFNLYVIYDKVAEEAGVPFDAKNDEIAKRKFEEVINRQIRPVKTVSVSDYELKQVGMFDSENCQIDSCGFEEAGARVVCDGSEVNEWTVETNSGVNIPSMENLSQVVGHLQSKPKKKHFWSK